MTLSWVGGRFVLVYVELQWTTTSSKLISSLIDMADQGAPQTAKESKLKGFRNRLKKIFGRDTPPSCSTSPPVDLVPTVPTITTDPEEAARLRAKYTHFRILIIGRANVGKTTLLKRVCNTKEDPVYSEVRYVRFALYPTLIIPSSTD